MTATMPTAEWWPLERLLREYRPGSCGDDWTWQDECDRLWSEPVHVTICDRLATSMQSEGQWDPVCLGNDGRVWDGHHRIVVAMTLGIDKVLVEGADLADFPPCRHPGHPECDRRPAGTCDRCTLGNGSDSDG